MHASHGVSKARRKILPAFLLLVGFAAGAPLQAQESGSVDSGDRVRVAWTGGSGEFLVQALLPDSLMLRREEGAETMAVPTQSLGRIEVFQGRTSYLTGGIQGAIAGGVFGAILTIPCRLPHGECEGFPEAQRLLASAGVGALLGAVLRGGKERWAEVTVPGQVTRVPTRLADSNGNTRGPSGDSDVITREQIAAALAQSAHDIVQRYRPQWLRPSRVQNVTGATSVASAGLGPDGDGFDTAGNEYATVFYEGRRFGDIDSLERFSPSQVEYIEYFSAREATTRYGTGYLGGVINVVPRVSGSSEDSPR